MAEGGKGGGSKNTFSDLLSIAKLWAIGKKSPDLPQSGINHSTQHSDRAQLNVTSRVTVQTSSETAAIAAPHINAMPIKSYVTSNNLAEEHGRPRLDTDVNTAQGHGLPRSNITPDNSSEQFCGRGIGAAVNTAQGNRIPRLDALIHGNERGMPSLAEVNRSQERKPAAVEHNLTKQNHVQGDGVAPWRNTTQGSFGRNLALSVDNTAGTSRGRYRERRARQDQHIIVHQRGQRRNGNAIHNIHPNQPNNLRGAHGSNENLRERQTECNQYMDNRNGGRTGLPTHRGRGGQGRRNAGRGNAHNLDHRPPSDTYYKKPWQNRDGHQETQSDGSRNHNGSQGEGRNKGREHVYHMYYKRLEDISDKDPSEVVVVLANNRNGFPELLNQSDQRPDMIVLIVKVLTKVCQDDFVANKASILSTVCNSKFLDNLSLHIAKIPMDRDHRRKEGLQEFFKNLTQFVETVVDLMPNTACDRLLSVLLMASQSMKNVTTIQNVSFDQKLFSKLTELEENLKLLLKETENKRVKETGLTEALKYQLPPDNFRDISIFPTPTDILSTERAFIRPNIIRGAYVDVEHYLDVQFRLLREDFVWPLRDGITQYLSQINQQRKTKTDNIRIYHKVRFEGVKVVMDHMGLVVSFECKSRIKWEYSKRLMFGSLLCFTQDNFKNVLFATVLERDVKDLEKGQIVVELSEGSEINDEIFQMNFIMVESEVYFEPYYHVLKALQKMKNREFPMSKYIVYVQSDTNPPQYVLKTRNCVWNIRGFQVPILVDGGWPTAEQLKLNSSQMKAFKAALTREFVVIQGPPGTGKTYLGLKIAQTLLQNVNKLMVNNVINPQQLQNRLQLNAHYYDSDDIYSDEEVEKEVTSLHSPMLVVCFTNHALDQFLEGLMSTTQKIIRVGGQSKSEALKQFNLREMRKSHKRTSNMRWLSQDIRHRLFLLMSRIKGIQEDMRLIDSHAGIVSINSIAEVYASDYLACFRDETNKLSKHMLLEWLLEGSQNFQSTPSAVPAMRSEMSVDPLAGLEQAMESDEEDLQRDDMDDYELGDTRADVKLTFILKFENVAERLETLRQIINQRQFKMVEKQQMVYDAYQQDEDEEADLDLKHRYFTHCLNNRPKEEPDVTPFLYQHVNLWRLNHAQRWSLYHTWMKLLRRKMLKDLRNIEADYRTEANQFEETKLREDLQMMRETDVVGMTTTGAARLQPLLQALKARIVIVEEAAEVMESHIIVSLTNHCQQLILIGDHQQLRPTTSEYRLAKQYHFDISLFERMLENGLHCEVIKVQHRMRPEIASLIVPSIYSELHNHESVLKYEKIRGIDKSVFFLSHNNPEQQVGETSSKQNAFEGNMMLALCRHLLLQGYSPDRITILTTYSGQMFYLREERKKHQSLKSVQITIVDNFQGEENDIILLSLVRNNKDNNVGFLKIANRVCVALSRARQGLYIMGNINNLTDAYDSRVWPEIKKALDKQEAVGEALMLRCHIHPHQITAVRSADDFNQVPEGGCRLPCDTELICGHVCKSICHVQDREHKEYKCHEPCTRFALGCVLEHVCPEHCYATCPKCLVSVVRELPCKHTKTLPCHVDHLSYKCTEKVSVTLTDCGHTSDKPCYKELNTYSCPHPCNARLDCGHSCTKYCHVTKDPDHLDYQCKKQCEKNNADCSQKHKCSRMCYEECGLCLMEVKKQPPNCDHMYKVECSLDPAKIVCERPCKRLLPCGHRCPMKCCQPCGNCPVKVKKRVVECGHEVYIKCCEEAERRHCNGPCQRNMSCGHRCMRVCKLPCSSSNICEQLVPSKVVPICGHGVQVPCRIDGQGLQSDSAVLLSYCREPCTAQLSCEHPCPGSCGDCFQGRIHKGCESDCGRTLICSHACSQPCTKACPPCKKRCSFRCSHSVCTRECGVPCVSCKERCPWKCDHLRCTKLCGEMCDREPCYEPCKKVLHCGHPCIGFCGEPCPPLCRLCDIEEVTTVFLGNEDEEDARFVYLVDCKHTIESEGLENWLKTSQDRSEIVMPKCPLCKSDIMNTMRFMNCIKQIFRDICDVKKKVYGEMRDIKTRKRELTTKLEDIKITARGMFTKVGLELIAKISQRLQTVQNNRKIYLSIVDTEFLNIQMDFFSELQNIYGKAYQTIRGDPRQTVTQYLDFLLSAVAKRDRFSEQEVSDFNMEIRRFQRITQLCQLETTMTSQPTNSKSTHHMSARNIALSVKKYTTDMDNELKNHLQKLSTELKTVLHDKERKDIVKAIGLEQGHWFKCRNGHPYAIADCGGAMEVAKCICGAAIGGTQHRLLADNKLAGEMDGATRSHWPGTTMM